MCKLQEALRKQTIEKRSSIIEKVKELMKTSSENLENDTSVEFHNTVHSNPIKDKETSHSTPAFDLNNVSDKEKEDSFDFENDLLDLEKNIHNVPLPSKKEREKRN